MRRWYDRQNPNGRKLYGNLEKVIWEIRDVWAKVEFSKIQV
jgi:hypothetical protein